MNTETIAKLIAEYTEITVKYTKLSDFIERIERGEAPFHDDHPVGMLYEQQTVMGKYLAMLKDKLEAAGVTIC